MDSAAAGTRTAHAHERLKKGVDQAEMRRKREATTVQIRKEKKEESIQKRRRDFHGITTGDTSASARVHTPSAPDPAFKVKLDALPEDCKLLQSSDPADQLEGTTRFRKLLSIERNPPITEVIACGAVPRLVQLCQAYDNRELLLEAAWALTNISSGTSEHTRVVIDNGAIPVFIHLVGFPHSDVREQAVWALGNIAGDSTRCRDLVLSYNHDLNMLSGLLSAMGDLTSSDSLSFLRNATWTISNLCRGKPPPRWPLIAAALPALAQLIHHSDEEILVDTCWALSYISDLADRIAHVLGIGVLPRLVELLGHASPNVQSPALRCIGNVTTGSAEQTQAVVACNALSLVAPLLVGDKRDIKKEACWMVSNITAGCSSHIDAVGACGLIPLLVQLVETEEFDIRKEAAYALCNACVGGSDRTLGGLLSLNVLPALCSLLDCSDAELVLAVCDALGAVLAAERTDVANDHTHRADLIDAAGGYDKLEALQMHENRVISSRAAHLIDTYFANGDDVTIAPQATSEGFVFGL